MIEKWIYVFIAQNQIKNILTERTPTCTQVEKKKQPKKQSPGNLSYIYL